MEIYAYGNLFIFVEGTLKLLEQLQSKKPIRKHWYSKSDLGMNEFFI